MQSAKTLFALALSILIIDAARSEASEPSAIVSKIVAPGSGIVPLQYVVPGQTIGLGKEGSIILGYLRSCVQEKITGGVVTINQTRSSVQNGRTTCERVECDGGKIMLTAEQARKSGVLIFRKPRPANTPLP